MKKIKTQGVIASAELQQSFRLLARKHGVSPGKIMEIVIDWQRWREKNLPLIAVQKVRSKIYSRVLRILCPIEFYWFGDKFDGCSIDVPKGRLSRYQERLIDDILEAILPALETTGIKPIVDIPPAIKKAFGEKL